MKVTDAMIKCLTTFGLLWILIVGCGPADKITNDIGMTFAYIPAGSFFMGSDSGEADEQPRHKVTLTKPFYMGIHEVTQGQWLQVMGETLEEHYSSQDQNLPLNGIGPDHPMYFVSWDDASTFIATLNDSAGDSLYRLPTEAEWEYAARAGNEGDYAGDLDRMAWYGKTSNGRIQPVGLLAPNAWGLYDMHGNVWEWCHDWLDREYYKRDEHTDPQGGTPGERRIIRGGCWFNDAEACRSGYRSYTSPGRGGPHLGFRVVRMVK